MNTTTYQYKGRRVMLAECHTSRGYFWEARIDSMVHGPFRSDIEAAHFVEHLFMKAS